MAKFVKPVKTSNDRAPMCRVCETRHWLREPHAFSKPAKAKRTKRD
jgi:hypothetical protein